MGADVRADPTLPPGYSYHVVVPGGYSTAGVIAVDITTREIFFANNGLQLYGVDPNTLAVSLIANNPWAATGSSFIGDLTDIDVLPGGDILLGGYQGSKSILTRVDRVTHAASLLTYFDGGSQRPGVAISDDASTIYMTDGWGTANLLCDSPSGNTGYPANVVAAVSGYACSLEMVPGTFQLVYHDYLGKTLYWYDLSMGTTTSVSLASLGLSSSSSGNFAVHPLTHDIYLPYSNMIYKIAADGSSATLFAAGFSTDWYIDLAFGPSILGGQSWQWSLFGTHGTVNQIFEIGGFGGQNPVPVPNVAWLLGFGLVGVVAFRRKFIKK